MTLKSAVIILSPLFFTFGCASVETKNQEVTKPTAQQALQQMTGCYLVDYNYMETAALKKGYKLDNRVYDVNKDKSVKEWIYAENISTSEIRLQHILFATDAQGKVIPGSELKHQAEDWEYNAKSLYEFTSPGQWKVTQLPENSNTWTRKITNLDDGLRYQCASSWNTDGAYPEWICNNYAPIPGRETRDMKRKDYNTLQRSTKIVVYGESWLERQENTKTLHEKNLKTPLAKEIGKNWYVRLPDRECQAAQDFANQHKPFWTILRQSWSEIYNKRQPFAEKTGGTSRYNRMMEIEQSFADKDLTDLKNREDAKQAILNAIRESQAITTSTSVKSKTYE